MRIRWALGLRAIIEAQSRAANFSFDLLTYLIMKQRDWLADFKDQCRRNLERNVEERMLHGFCYVYKPVMDDAPWRSFNSTAEYRQWCIENLPKYLGYGEPDAQQLKVIDEA